MGDVLTEQDVESIEKALSERAEGEDEAVRRAKPQSAQEEALLRARHRLEAALPGKCAKCRADLQKGARYCSKCGAKVGAVGADVMDAADSPQEPGRRERAIGKADAPDFGALDGLEPEDLEALALALGEVAEHHSERAHVPQIGEGDAFDIYPVKQLGGKARALFARIAKLPNDEVRAWLKTVEARRAGPNNDDTPRDELQRDAEVAKAGVDALSEINRLAKQKLANGVRKADGKPLTMADALLEVGAEHPDLWRAYQEGVDAGAFTAQPARSVRKAAPDGPAWRILESRAKSLVAKSGGKLTRVEAFLKAAEEDPELYERYRVEILNV